MAEQSAWYRLQQECFEFALTEGILLALTERIVLAKKDLMTSEDGFNSCKRVSSEFHT